MSGVSVYVMAAYEGGVALAPVKVGISADVEKRLRSIQTSCPFPVRLAGQICCPTREVALAIERFIHQRHKSHKTHGEWFDIPPHRAVAILGVAEGWIERESWYFSPTKLAEAVQMAMRSSNG